MARKIHSSQVRAIDADAGGRESSTTWTPTEPCVVCGEETGVGSVFFSDRFTLNHDEGEPSYLCQSCQSRIRSRGRGSPLTDQQVRQLVENGSAIALAWRP